MVTGGTTKTPGEPPGVFLCLHIPLIYPTLLIRNLIRTSFVDYNVISNQKILISKKNNFILFSVKTTL